MLENYLVKGLAIGIVFGIPAGVVGALAIQRALTQGPLAGLMTGIGSSVADAFYASVGVFGMTVISDFLLKRQRFICMVGCLMVVAMGVQTFRKKRIQLDTTPHAASCFLSSFTVAIANPAAIVSFMVVFSIFRIGGTESTAENVQLVFGIFCGTCMWWLAVAAIASLFRKRITDGIYLKMNRIFGVLLVLFGIAIGLRGCLLTQ